MTDRFSTPMVCRLTGLKFSTLNFWDLSGFLSPSICQAEGPGTRRAYSFADLVALRVARELREKGFPLQQLRKVVATLENMGFGKPVLASTYLICSGEDVILVRGEKELVSVLRCPGQGVFACFVVDLSGTVRELKEEIERIAA